MPIQTKFDSKVIEGASFTLKTPGRTLRHRVELALAKIRHKEALIQRDQSELIPERFRETEQSIIDRISQFTQSEQETFTRIAIEKVLVEEEIQIEYAKHMMESFHLPGEEYADLKTADLLFEYGPVDFTGEILEQSRGLWAIRPSEAKN